MPRAQAKAVAVSTVRSKQGGELTGRKLQWGLAAGSQRTRE